mmetsp:Transcript_67075/g.135207  ORF Transcript_67075/g.135207 Transcript_67075/m.135207 type:complete len:161 (+) Transcript_67075:154-636(+)|eukprot:CAMPEP_0171636404 /NCGR_PEP_ID=MMETSP0990-20121206/27385_1 /TAXON_ID=483369 /ORGANISM="non described non described, Strain CCMP2098" /LENGTH=160 /DNA_ID=CAMNT_0012208519 /DNA_START=146 /DNA_END=628 /DNA_ORIENTATION=-
MAAESKPPTEEELRELKEIFNLVDKDGSGSVSAGELGELMQTLGVETSTEEVASMIRELDDRVNGGNNDGEVQFDEFLQVMSRKVNASFTSDQVKTAFEIFEASDSKSGTISVDALITALTSYGTTKLSIEHASALVNQLEPDAAGNIDYIDYVNLMMHD